MKKMLFLVNPKAGKKVVKNKIFEMITIFTKAGYHVEFHPTLDANDAALCAERLGAKYDLIVCAGGDGTLDNTISGMMKLKEQGIDVPLGYIPCGSTNDFGKSLRLSMNPVKASRDIVKGTDCPIDVGVLGGQNFIYVAAFGIFTEISYSTPQKLKNMLGHTAYIIEAFKELSRIDPVKIVARLDDKMVKGEFLYGQITNSLSVGGFKLIGPRDVSFCDGEFECLFIKKPKSPLELAKILKSIATNKMDPKLVYHTKAKDIKIIGEKPISWTVDGEDGGVFKEVTAKNIHKAITLRINDKSTYGEDNE
ncbi:MAG: YegS/Rv2252/BmrU family lipid kinase [Eubacterium sp.]|nr:YegS/Rv2252/BmrU family lipid kinase [Eubacterium sp.]MBR1673991.1 YegS/Rv2252/BmrU family lipid kinase [Eubacterium sp.]